MPGITFHGFHQIWHELGAPLELDVDSAPGLVRHLARAHQTVENDDDVQNDRHSDE